MPTTCPHCKNAIPESEQQPAVCPSCGGPLMSNDFRLEETIAGPIAASAPAGRPELKFHMGDYRLIRALGQGGMGVVWEAEQAETGRRVALKVLSPNLHPTEETIDRFIREGRLAASLSHPRSTFVFGAGEHDGQPYIVMELMPGRTLKDVVDEEGPLPVNRAVDYVLDAVDGLAAAHGRGIIHRDVKPSNCFIDGDGRVKVGDFGLSKSLVSDAALTQTGAFLGTPQFAAPEQVRAGTVDERTDVYAVGATLFSLIAGRGPFEGDAVAVIAQIVSDSPASLRELRPDTPRALAQIVARCLEKDPARRYANLLQLREALLPFASGGTSIADVGRRMAAYMLDQLAGNLVATLLIVLASSVAGAIAFAAGTAPLGNPSYVTFISALGNVLGALWLMAFFAVSESWWGRGPGKWLMGLRVVDMNGEKPALWRTALRAFVVPGALGLTVGGAAYSMIHTRVEPSPSANMTQSMAVASLTMVVMLLCLTTMRRRTGYRGLHELASGTRVVRIKTDSAAGKLSVPLLVPVKTPLAGRMLGPFRVTGKFGLSGSREILLANDELLDRTVWMHVARSPEDLPASTCVTATRPTRPHWLQRGNTDGMYWDAYEAIEGAPLSEVVRHGRGLDWGHTRNWLRDLAEELAASAASGTLPKRLALDQVWVNRGGLIKVLDECLDSPTGQLSAPSDQSAMPSAEQAVELLRSAVDLCSRGELLPVQVQQFVRELHECPADRGTLEWAARELADAAARPALLRWDDRLGILGVSMGTEFTLFLFICFLVPLTIWNVPGMNDAWRLIVTLAVGLSAPFLLGFWLQGGPVFRFMKVEVRRTNGEPASRWRCGWRNLVAWTPCLVFYSVVGVAGVAMLAEQQNVLGGSDHGRALVLIPLMLASQCLLFLFVCGAVYAVVRPRRGLPDLLANTCLVPA